jgi:hypothetical protein
MFILPWARMPTNWIRSGILKDNFTPNVNLAEKISALKIYVILCIKANDLNGSQYSCVMTYDSLMELAFLSRSSVSKGLKLLHSLKLIESCGVRTKRYTITNLYRNGWCKLPVKGFMRDDANIESFKMFHNRYSHELNAIKLYLYLLSIRSNKESFSEVSFGKIKEKTGVKIQEISPALGFMNVIGLLDSKCVLLPESLSVSKEDSVVRYYLSNNQNLVNKEKVSS